MLNKAELELRDYALKIETAALAKIVLKAGELGVSDNTALACAGSTFLRIAAMTAAERNIPRDDFLTWAKELYDNAKVQVDDYRNSQTNPNPEKGTVS